jgi:RHS repeat-associated protein
MGEKFAANPVTGTSSMSVPLATSPGRSGFGPQLSLSYDSGSGNGPFGFGWSLSIPAITRKTDRGLPKYSDAEESDIYILSGAEDLVPVLQADGTRFKDDATAPGYVVHRYRPRIESLFARIERWTRIATGEIHWRSITRDNVTTLYGKDNDSCIVDPGDLSPANPTRVFSWLICASYDDKGNAIVYEYAAENDDNVDRGQANERNRLRTANRYLKRIKYGNRLSRLIQPDLAQASWMFEVVFDYDEAHHEDVDLDPALPEAEQHRFVRASASMGRPWAVRLDPFSSHRAGFEVRTYRRCRRVLMFHHIPDLPTGEKGYDGLVRSTEFDYADLDYRQPVAIEDELAHHGSTYFASFIRAVTQSGYVRDDTQAVVVRNGVQYVTYLKKSLPPLEFEYSKAAIQEQVLELDAASLENLPAGLDGSTYQWVDLDGEGVSGILTEQAGAWFYKPNLGGGRFGPFKTVAAKPSLADLSGGRQQLLDLAGDGQLDLVALAGPTPGFYERTYDEEWEPFRAFRQLPNIRWDEPNLRFVDLDGNGHADVLITEQDVFTWHPSLAEEGFGPARSVHQPLDEERGARLVLADGTRSIYLADMCGDGLTDLVRICNGEVCYWPNLGYGRFGAKVTMDNAPWFDYPDQFDQRRVRLADIDGSGTNDIIYLARDAVHLYFNQSGNRLSERRRLPQFPRADNVSSVMTADLLGNGTACLVWSSPLPADARRPLRYIDLMGGTKPHLLVKSVNNLGAETVVQYAPSTKFYLQDKRDGNPWITRLPFPVHVVERVETHDHISRNHFVTRYAYHHGYFDGEEREFRGFGMVNQWDTEELAALTGDGTLPAATNVDTASHVPPVLTKTWFHTGVYLGRDHISDYFAGLLDANNTGEYYREPGLTETEARAFLLDDTVLPDGLTIDEEREACRGLKGSMLRQEVYALDGTLKEKHPYTVTEQNFTIRLLQRRGDNRHAVFFTHAREAISYHYERDPADPRVGHALTLEVDEFGNVLQSAAVGYGRRQPDTALSPADQAKQTQVLITYTENRVTNAIEAPDDHRTPLPCESRTCELTGLTLSPGSSRFTFDEVLDAGTRAVALDYEMDPTAGLMQKRLIEQVRTYYRRDDLAGPLALGDLQSLALPFETYKLAFTPGLVSVVYGGRASDAMIEDEGRYVHSEGDSNWWIPSGQTSYSSNAADMPPQELAYARQHFFLPHRYRDPFHTNAVSTESFVTYDTYDLLVQETRDALGNRVTVGERNLDPTQAAVRLRQDYRVLQPALVMDPNRNRSEVAFDALGMVVGTAVMGKPEEVAVPGDRLAAAFRADSTQAEIDQLLASPKGPMAPTLLDEATTRIVYDLTAYWREPDPTTKPPAVAATLARETHASEPVPAGGLRIQSSFSYSDGFGREIQKKIQAEPGSVPTRDATGKIIVGADGHAEMTPDDVSPRWVGSGWTVFNNKGKPVRQYEPFFTDTHRFEFDVRIGVSPLLFYDPVERVVATLHPNHTWEKVVFDPWRQETWDVNDTVLMADPKTDPDVGDSFALLPDADYLPTWHARRQGGALGAQGQSAASKAAAHTNTPTTAHFDTLGRPFLTLADNGPNPAHPGQHLLFATRVDLDIEGNQREVRDAIEQNGDPQGRIVMRYDYSIAGPEKEKEAANRIHQVSMDAGERWMLNDVTGKPIRAWDSRGHECRSFYDQLRRPIESYMRQGAGLELMVGHTVHGETRLNPEADNLRGKVVQQFDQAGVVTSDAYDFKGNALRSQRQLAVEYKATLDWSVTVPPEAETYASSTRYDALNRPTELTAPDNSLIRPTYNEANLLERVEANVRGAASATPFVVDIDYDAKGQRTLVAYGNGVKAQYAYDRETFRLTRLTSTRPVTLPADERVVQDLSYTYDPAGNITHISDDADIQNVVFFRNQRVEPSADYIYDATYRLVEATGREHLGQVGGTPTQPGDTDAPRVNLPHPGDGNAMGNYTERYEYDSVGNILAMIHLAQSGGWTRRYAYNDASLIEPGKTNNRLSSTSLPGDDPAGPYHAAYSHDEHGNMTAMPHLTLMQWDHHDQLQATARQVVNTGTPETTYYVYDAAGERVRKVTERHVGASQTPTRLKERIHLGGFDLYREYGNDGAAVALERETLYIMDDKQRIALVETKTVDADVPANTLPETLTRYQFGNHLGSASLELADQAQIISYEEYTPYGSTSYQAVRSQTETPKRYRYTGKERDEESGLYYHGARHYAPWLGRWLSADHAGLVDGPCLYQYSLSNPVVLVDRNGMSSTDPSFSEVFRNAVSMFGGEGQGFSIKGTTNRAKDGTLVSQSISIVGPGTNIVLDLNNGAWSYEETLGGNEELPGVHSKGSGLPSVFSPKELEPGDAGAGDESSALEIGADIATDFIPFVGSGKDIYKGIRDGSGWMIALGVGGLALDVFTLGSASIVEGSVKTIVKQGAKELVEQGAKELVEQGAKEAVEHGAKAAADRGITVLGKDPKYQELAHELDAAYFQVLPAKWDAMTVAEQEAANFEFLDIQIRWGSEFRLSNSGVNPTGTFKKEIEYMTKTKGFRLASTGKSLVRK